MTLFNFCMAIQSVLSLLVIMVGLIQLNRQRQFPNNSELCVITFLVYMFLVGLHGAGV